MRSLLLRSAQRLSETIVAATVPLGRNASPSHIKENADAQNQTPLHLHR